jgi:5'-methylthioadenosine phosphorylase
MGQGKLAFIVGSGMSQGLEKHISIINKQVNVENKFGKVLCYYEGMYMGKQVVIMPRHGEGKDMPSRPPSQMVSERGYEANIWQLHELGVTEIFGLSAVGSIDLDVPLADKGYFIVPDQYMRGFAATQHSFGVDAKVIHPNMADPFTSDSRLKALAGICRAGYQGECRAIYIYNGGDCFETPAEIEFINNYKFEDRKRIVGMTTVPEAILAAQMQIPFAAICSNVNYAQGLSKETPVSHEQTIKIMDTAAKKLTEIVTEIIQIS